VFDVGLKQGSPNPDVPGMSAQKRQLLDAAFGGLLNHLFISGNLPSYAQVMVLRLGNHVIGTVPGEVTTTAGRRMREQMLAGARARAARSAALILGHANGYLGYIATAEEYTARTTKAARRCTVRGRRRCSGARSPASRGQSPRATVCPRTRRHRSIWSSPHRHIVPAGRPADCRRHGSSDLVLGNTTLAARRDRSAAPVAGIVASSHIPAELLTTTSTRGPRRRAAADGNRRRTELQQRYVVSEHQVRSIRGGGTRRTTGAARCVGAADDQIERWRRVRGQTVARGD